jgi:hypothetical protein
MMAIATIAIAIRRSTVHCPLSTAAAAIGNGPSLRPVHPPSTIHTTQHNNTWWRVMSYELLFKSFPPRQRVRIQLFESFPPRRGFEFNFSKVSRQDEGSNSTFNFKPAQHACRTTPTHETEEGQGDIYYRQSIEMYDEEMKRFFNSVFL